MFSHLKTPILATNPRPSSTARIVPAFETLEGRQLMSAVISGSVFNDKNAAGVFQRGDTNLGGVRVYVDTTNAGVYKAGDPYAMTDITGRYTIKGLTPGMKIVREVTPSGFRQTAPANNAAQDVVLLNNSSVVNGIVFGDTQKVRVSGVVYDDSNKDGNRQSAEPYRAGVTVFLDTNGNGILDAGERSTTTNADGYFVMDNLAPGQSYIVDVDLAGSKAGAYSGWIQTQPFQEEYRKTLQNGQSFDNLKFGIHAPAKVTYGTTTRYLGAAGNEQGSGFANNGTGHYAFVAEATDLTTQIEAKSTINSNISTGGIFVSGTLLATEESRYDFATDQVDVTFTVAAATVYHLNYSITGNGFDFELKHLKAGAPDIIGLTKPTSSDPTLNYAKTTGGTLAAGTYELIFNNNNSVANSFRTTAFSMNFAI